MQCRNVFVDVLVGLLGVVHLLVEVERELLLVALTLLRKNSARLPSRFPTLGDLGRLLRFDLVSERRTPVLLELVYQIDTVILVLTGRVESGEKRAFLARVLLRHSQVIAAIVPWHLRIP